MIQDLAGIVEDGGEGPDRGTDGGLNYDVLQGHRHKLRAGDELVEVIDITLQMLAVVEGQGLGANRGCQCIGRVREVNQGEHSADGFLVGSKHLLI